MGLAAVLLLAGCSAIPSAGPVQPGTTEEPNGTSIVYAPNPPAPGASQRDIVSGFLTAASAGGRLQVAKQYLTPGFAAKWKPNSRVLVQASQPTSSANGNVLTLEMPVTAKVDAEGVYTQTTATVPLVFHLTQRSGEWRIDQAPDGIVLTPTVFARNYKPQSLEFYDESWSRLVPDLRWFPSDTTAPSSSAVVAALIAGPAGPLAGGVTMNALHGATVQGVDAASTGMTTVTLRTTGQGPDAATLTRMQQQLIQSLRLPTPNALRLVVNDKLASPVKSLVSQSPQPAAYVVANGRFGTLSSSGTFTEDGTLGRRIEAENPSAITVSLRQGLAAVLTGAGEVAVVTTSGARTVDSRSGVVAPALDQRGWTYSVPADSPNAFTATDAGGNAIQLVSSLPSGTVRAIEVSPDGTRMLVVLQRPNGPVAFVKGILRNPDGTPTGLTDAQYAVDLGGNTGLAVDATWVDPGDVAVLVNSPDGSTERVQLQQLGGLSSPLGSIPNATAIVGTSSTSDLRVLLQTGDLFVWQDPSWQAQSSTAPSVSVLAVQR